MAELLVGGAFLSTFLQVAFGRLASKAVIDYFRRKKLDLHLLEELNITMLSIDKVIDYAEGKEITDPRVMKWLDKLKEAVYDAEDVLDVISTLDHTYKMKTTFHRLTSKLRPSWNPFDTTIHKELDRVLQTFKLLLQQKDVLGLKESHRPNSDMSMSTTTRVQSTSLVEESDVYGRNVDKERIMELLLSNDQSNASVIAIIGMGGIGKTTLAQLVFNSDYINELFKLNKVWICVSEDYNITKITKNILEKLTLQSYDTNDLDLLQMKLQETLSGKKFLIVLDDIWNEDDMDWDILRKPFNSGATGSKIIVTTRNTRVASAMRASSTYKLQVLSDEDCWLLFAKHAFENISPSEHSKFEVVGRKLVKKCQGLPLAARVLGGLLRTKVAHTEEWDEILNNDIWNSSDEESKNKILPVLRLSYHYLPSHLKRCFAFCSLIPKDFQFEREKIVKLWMAESLLADCGGKKRKMDIGYEYLGDLESRSLIQPSSFSLHKKSHFEMHDLVNDLATAVSEDFYKRCDIPDSVIKVGKQTRHFSYVMPNKILEVISNANRLRSLTPLYNYGHLHLKIFGPLKLIRTLTLSNNKMKKLPSSIGNLKLLRYLDLSHSFELNELPESLASLYNLEVLNLSGCWSLTKLPSKMRQLTKLNHLDIRSIRLKEMPLQMGRLKDLDVLTDFVVGKGSGLSIAELKELKYLRGELSIRGLHNITHPQDTLEVNLKEKSFLEELKLRWRIIDSDNSEAARIILENLIPHVNLKKLSIDGYSGTRLPDWLGHCSFVNLADIIVVYFKHCFDLSPLGRLPSLESLHIFGCDSLVTLVGTEIPVALPNVIHHHVGHFSALVRLQIHNCPKLELPQQNHCFTSIEDLTIRNSCASLQLFPRSLFPKLKKLNLTDLKSIESLEVIDEANNINLEAIRIMGCKKLIANHSIWGLQRLVSLSTVEVGDFDLEYFPEEGLLPSSLTTLWIRDVSNLRNLNGKSFHLLTSLQELYFYNCPKLQCLPQLPTSLSTLQIDECPLLESRCQREQGEDWSKIAHIPNIIVSTIRTDGVKEYRTM